MVHIPEGLAKPFLGLVWSVKGVLLNWTGLGCVSSRGMARRLSGPRELSIYTPVNAGLPSDMY